MPQHRRKKYADINDALGNAMAFGRGATLGGGPEAVAFLSAIMSPYHGGNIGDRYDQALDKIEGTIDTNSSAWSEFAGGVLSAALLAKLYPKSAAITIPRLAAVGAGEGAVAGFLSANDDRNWGALTGAMFGGPMGALAGVGRAGVKYLNDKYLGADKDLGTRVKDLLFGLHDKGVQKSPFGAPEPTTGIVNKADPKAPIRRKDLDKENIILDRFDPLRSNKDFGIIDVDPAITDVAMRVMNRFGGGKQFFRDLFERHAKIDNDYEALHSLFPKAAPPLNNIDRLSKKPPWRPQGTNKEATKEIKDANTLIKVLFDPKKSADEFMDTLRRVWKGHYAPEKSETTSAEGRKALQKRLDDLLRRQMYWRMRKRGQVVGMHKMVDEIDNPILYSKLQLLRGNGLNKSQVNRISDFIRSRGAMADTGHRLLGNTYERGSSKATPDIAELVDDELIQSVLRTGAFNIANPGGNRAAIEIALSASDLFMKPYMRRKTDPFLGQLLGTDVSDLANKVPTELLDYYAKLVTFGSANKGAWLAGLPGRKTEILDERTDEERGSGGIRLRELRD